MTLETDRLVLRQWTGDDAEAAFDLYSRRDVMRYIGRAPRVLEKVDEAAALIERWHTIDDGTYGIWAVTVRADPSAKAGSAPPVGSVLLKSIPASDTGDPPQPSGDIEIGWHLHPDVWGRGYATEAATAVLDHAWSRGLDRVVAVTHAENEASQAVCRRLGMTHRGTTTAYYDVECELFDVVTPLPR